MPTLLVLQGPDKGRTFKTGDALVLLGRGSDDVPLTDRTVSRRHAELKLADGVWILTDSNSANGTYLNGKRVTRPASLKHGDQIRVGSTLLVYAGDETVEQMSGANIPRDLVTLDAGGQTDAAIMASVASNEDSVVMAAPETAEAVKAWKVVRELTEVIGHMLPPEQLLARVLDLVFEQVPVERAVVFRLRDDDAELIPEVVRFRSSKGRPAAPDAIIASQTIMRHVVNSRAGVLCTNAVSDKRFESGKSVQNLGMRSVICVPIMAGDRVIGVIHLDCPLTRHTYNEAELRLMTAIGYQTGLAIENARLLDAAMQRERLAAAGEAVAYLSHYIKNILAGMRAGSDTLRRGLEKRDFAVTATGWQIVNRNLDKIFNLTMNMLAFGKEREPRLEMLNVNAIVQEVVSLVAKQADDARVMLLTDLAEDMPAIPLDYDGIHQVILNLATNALEAVPRTGGRININTAYDLVFKHAVVTVSDNGPGVPEVERKRIFEAFHSTKGHGGTGLGLAAAKKIISEMGGAISVAEAAGGGAEFTIRLKAYDTRAPGADDTQGPAA